MTGVWFAGIRAIVLALGVQEAPGGASFVGARLSVDAQQEGPRDATIVCGRPRRCAVIAAFNLGGCFPRTSHDKVRVQQAKRLQGDCGSGTAACRS